MYSNDRGSYIGQKGGGRTHPKQHHPVPQGRHLTDHWKSTNIATNTAQPHTMTSVPLHHTPNTMALLGCHTIANPSQAILQPDTACLGHHARVSVGGRGRGQRSPSAGTYPPCHVISLFQKATPKSMTGDCTQHPHKPLLKVL